MFDPLKGLGGLGNLGSLMEMAQQIPGKAEEFQRQLGEVRETGSAGGGMVTVEATGKQQIVSVRIDPEAASASPEALAEMMQSAANDALTKTRSRAADLMSEMTKDLPIPGIDAALKKFTGNV